MTKNESNVRGKVNVEDESRNWDCSVRRTLGDQRGVDVAVAVALTWLNGWGGE